MTTIELFTDDQKLYYAKKVYIASGDVKSVQLQVDFCGAWDGYPVRTATFTNDTSKISVDKVMTRNKCTVPFEVLTKSGTLYVSIVGDAADGSKRKTSGRIKYRVDVGAELSDITLTPTKDVYQQFLAAVYEMEDPITQSMLAEIGAKSAALDAKFEALQSNCLKPCDFTNKIHTMTENNEEWTATQDCWVSLYISHANEGYYANIYVNNALAVSAMPFTSSSVYTSSFTMPPVYVKKGAVVKFTRNTSNANASIFTCAE